MLISFCSARGQDLPPSRNAEPDQPVKAKRPPNVTRSLLGDALIRAGYESVKLIRDRKTWQLFLNCTANGKAICLSVDTGTSRTCIGNEPAKALQLTATGSGTLAAGGSELLSVKTARIQAFGVGDLPKIAKDVFIVDDSAIRALAKEAGHRIKDGELGTDWFAQHLCVLDFADDTLYYLDPAKQGELGKRPANHPAADNKDDEVKGSLVGSAMIRSGFGFIKAARDKNTAELFVNCTANGTDLCLKLDTGATLTGISQDTAKALKLTPKDAPFRMAMTGSAISNVRVAQIEDMRMGELRLPRTTVLVFDYSAGRNLAKQEGGIVPDGLLGASWLYYCAAVIDFGHDVLYYFPSMLKRQLTLLAGNWQATKVQRFGFVETADKTKKWRLKVENEWLEWQDESTWRYAFGVNQGYPYCQIDFLAGSSNAADQEKKMVGIYEFDETNNRLTLCISMYQDETSRPTKLESGKGSNVVLIEYEKVQEKQR